MKVYIVTSGEYSDYHIDAVFTDKKKAETYYSAHNSEGYPYFIEVYDIDKYGISAPCGVYEYIYEYKIKIDLRTKDIVILSIELAKKKSENDCKLYVLNGWGCYIARTKSEKFDACYCWIYLKEIDDKKAKKIAADMCAKALAEANNL